MISAESAFLEGFIDYAGLFPPASLSMSEAIEEYLRFSERGLSWFAPRVVIPAARFSEFVDAALRLNPAKNSPLLQVSLLLPALDSSEASQIWGNSLSLFNETGVYVSRSCSSLIQLGALESPLPRLDNESIFEFFPQAFTDFFSESRKSNPHIPIFFEVPCSSNKAFVLAVQQLRQSFGPTIGAKLRLGGTSIGSVPNSQDVARTIGYLRDYALGAKVTAGLHEALRHFDSKVGCHFYGYLNVFFSFLFAYSHQISVEQIEGILLDESPKNFEFAKQCVRYKNWTLPAETLQQLRLSKIKNLGSCSVEEPILSFQKLFQSHLFSQFESTNVSMAPRKNEI